MTFTGHSSWIYSVAWSPAGDKIASGSSDNTVKVIKGHFICDVKPLPCYDDACLVVSMH